MTQQFVKAALIAQDGAQDIEFMFNPGELEFSQSVSLSRGGDSTDKGSGARTLSGRPKVSFAYPEVRKLNISNILFDTYEKGTSVLVYTDKIVKSLEFIKGGSPARPPIYLFTWGQQKYLKCFVVSFNYKLNMFLPDGTPVRAVANLSLEEADELFGEPLNG